MITIIGCNKGGSGKTTTAVNAAIGLAINGHDVCFVDADPQRSGTKFFSTREELSDKCQVTVIEKRDNISQTLLSLRSKYSHVIVDVPGRNSRELITGATVADQIIAPHQCSQLDLDTLEELQEQVVRIRDINPLLKVYIYHSMATNNHVTRPQERKEFFDFVSDYDAVTLLRSIGFYRKVYKDSIAQGLSVLEMRNPQARSEILSLISEIF